LAPLRAEGFFGRQLARELAHWRSAARPVAAQFWQRLAEHTAVGRDFRGVAAEMLHRVNTAGPA